MQICPACGTHVAPALLSCPSCRWLVHAERLKQLADDARRAEQARDISTVIALWRQALELLPSSSRQHEQILATIETLGRRLESGAQRGSSPASSGQTTTTGSSQQGRKLTIAGLFGLALLKGKWAIVLLLTKGKLLLLGLTKASTLLSMLLSFGVYWTAWGWKFALGLVASIYIHEMGHVAMLRRYGIRASAPMFIPGVGAFVRMKQPPLSAREDARVGLAGPWWGLATAAVGYGVFRATGWATWAAIAQAGGWLTIVNLLPLWQLDGSRGFQALSRPQRWTVMLVAALLWWASREGLLILLVLVAGVRAVGHDAPKEGDVTTLTQYVWLVMLSSLLTVVRVPLPRR